MEKIKNKIEIVKRKDYKELINFIKENKDIENKEKIKEIYEKRFKLKFSNIERLIKRSLRKESKENFNLNLKNENLSLENYLVISKKIINMSKNKEENILINCEKIIK